MSSCTGTRAAACAFDHISPPPVNARGVTDVQAPVPVQRRSRKTQIPTVSWAKSRTRRRLSPRIQSPQIDGGQYAPRVLNRVHTAVRLQPACLARRTIEVACDYKWRDVVYTLAIDSSVTRKRQIQAHRVLYRRRGRTGNSPSSGLKAECRSAWFTKPQYNMNSSASEGRPAYRVCSETWRIRVRRQVCRGNIIVPIAGRAGMWRLRSPCRSP